MWIPTSAQNALSVNWGKEIEKVSELLGWEYTTIDGKGTAQGWTDAMTQAIALGPDVIMYSADARTLATKNQEAMDEGVIVIGIHGLALPGPDEATGLYSNITSDPRDIGAAMADYLIARTCGTAKGVVLFDSVYEIAEFKGVAMARSPRGVRRLRGARIRRLPALRARDASAAAVHQLGRRVRHRLVGP